MAVNDAEWKVGDVVRLKSGGPKMTVTSCSDPYNIGRNTASCIWFDGLHPVKEDFPPDALEKVNTNEKNQPLPL
jgi:uncharacterized protein YodC (DUF2158 family)